MERKKKISQKTGRCIFIICMAAVSLIFIYPLIYTILASLKDNQEIFSNPFGFPKALQFGNYIKAWGQARMQTYFLNSVFITGVTMFFHLLLGSMAAFVIARFQLKISRFMAGFFALGMMIPIQSILIPITKMAVSFHMSDNYLFLLGVYIAGGLPSTTFIMSNYLGNFSSEIEEAAIMDGCGMGRFYLKMLVPISKPIFVTMGIMSFISTWNELMVAMVLIKENSMKTLPLGLLNFTGAYSTDYAGLCAAIVITAVPIIIMYLLMQEHVEQGLTEGAVKG